MFCGVCRQENPTEHNFCSGCGKPLRSSSEQPPQNGHYSIILTTAPHDEFERFRLIKQLAGLIEAPESEARALVASAPSIIASAESLEGAESLQKRLSELMVETLIRPVGQEQLELLREQAMLETRERTAQVLEQDQRRDQSEPLQQRDENIKTLTLNVVQRLGAGLIGGFVRAFGGTVLGALGLFIGGMAVVCCLTIIGILVGVPLFLLAGLCFAVAKMFLLSFNNTTHSSGEVVGAVVGLLLGLVLVGSAWGKLSSSNSPPQVKVKPLTAVEHAALDEMQRDMEAGRFYDDAYYFRKYPGLCENARGLTAEERRRYCGR